MGARGRVCVANVEDEIRLPQVPVYCPRGERH